MICRRCTDGEKLKVGDLNEITVLIDRSETSLTEVAMNFLRPRLNGPPHSHTGKEQVFFVTEGNGIVNVDKESYSVKPGTLVYIPEGVVHQSVTDDSSLRYFLFNAFLEPTKEGCANYADHIEKVKAIREQQAATGKATSDPNLGKRVSVKKPHTVADARGTTSGVLVAHTDTEGCDVERVGLGKGDTRAVQYDDREQTLFVLSGSGTMTVGNEICEVTSGVVVFVPTNAPQSVKAGDHGLTYLGLSTFTLP